jgi:hypothetical protein
LWKNPARRDKQWNYIALQFQRYTKHVQPTRYIYEHVANVWGIPIPKRMVPKYYFLSELLKEYYKVDDFIIQQNHKTLQIQVAVCYNLEIIATSLLLQYYKLDSEVSC